MYCDVWTGKQTLTTKNRIWWNCRTVNHYRWPSCIYVTVYYIRWLAVICPGVYESYQHRGSITGAQLPITLSERLFSKTMFKSCTNINIPTMIENYQHITSVLRVESTLSNKILAASIIYDQLDCSFSVHVLTGHANIQSVSCWNWLG